MNLHLNLNKWQTNELLVPSFSFHTHFFLSYDNFVPLSIPYNDAHLNSVDKKRFLNNLTSNIYLLIANYFHKLKEINLFISL